MTRNHRAAFVCAVLGLSTILGFANVRGDASKKKDEPIGLGSKAVPDASDRNFAEDLAKSKFSDAGVVTYETKDGEKLFALQVQPKLDAGTVRPRDLVVVVDTSASQVVGGALAAANRLAEEIVQRASPQDRIALWTVNIPAATRNLTAGGKGNGFKAPASDAAKEALTALKNEVPLGNTDLKTGLNRIVQSFDDFDNVGQRQRAILFLGDGYSSHNPVTSQDRSKLVDEMVKREIAFFPIPLGPRLDPQNLHGLATGTGGKVVRALPGTSLPSVAKNVETALAAPILYPTNFELTNGEVTEYYPTKLPPLRGDASTLVLGKFKGGLALGYTVVGNVRGNELAFRGTERIRDSELDNFFLVGMLRQWKNAKDQPAIMQADRALAFALEMNQMARTEILAQAQMALDRDKFDSAAKLFDQAQQLDPHDTEAQGGARLAMLLKDGKINKDQLREQVYKKDGMALKLEKSGGKAEFRRDQMKNLVALAGVQDNKLAPPPAAAILPEEKDDLIKKQQQLVKIEEERVKQIVNDSLRLARQELYIDPEEARNRLKNLLADVRDNHPDISARVRQDLVNSLTASLRNIETEGARVKQAQEEKLRLRAREVAKLIDLGKKEAMEERTRERMRVFNQLMATARYEDAYRVALEVQQDAVKAGEPVPVAVTAAYDIGLVANNLREVHELKRVREERFLLTMMQVEKSHVPFPDEPPVQFPPAAVWRELTKIRKEKYESSGLTDDDPVALAKIKKLRDLLNKPINQDEFTGPLKEVLSYLGDRYEVPIIVDTEAFKQDLMLQEVENQAVKIPKMSQVSFGTVMRLILAQVQGTYIIRRDFIEVTTAQRQAAEKTIRVYPVADLVIPIPNAFNQQGVNQSVQNSILGAQLGMMGGGLGMLGGGLGMLGGGLGMLGGGLGMGGLGMLGGGLGMGGGLGAMGLAGGGLQGAGGGFQGGGCSGLGFAGGTPMNMGLGGGFSGFGGGQMGQLGNLGGQFGIQGGDQSMILITLIRQVVGMPEDWSPLSAFQRKQGGFGEGPDQEEPGVGNPNQASALGYYPPSRALVVKATSRIHTRLGGGLLGPRTGPPGAPGGPAAGLQINRPGALVLGDRKKLDPGNPLRDVPTEVASRPREQTAKEKVAALAAAKKLDPKSMWQEALEQGVNDPGLIIATTDFLVQNKKFDHAAEFLKANLRRGIVVRPWVYEALAISLKEAGGSLTDIERTQVSLVDLEPQDAGGYLRASTAVAENKHYGQALAFCRQASLLEPNSPHPYADALKYAQYARDSEGMEWAAGNILSRDWPLNNHELHDEAKGRLNGLTEVLNREKRTDEAGHMASTASSLARRDLEITLSWQGQAGLDLEVKEPIGTTCSFMQRQTPGGGILLGNNLAELTRETYVAAEAFSGAYEVTVRKIWGRALGARATLEIVQNKGTPQENIRRETIVLDEASQTIKVVLDEGRRKSVADVSPSASVQRPKETQEERLLTGDQMLTKLRMMADPEFTGQEKGFRGDVGSTGRASQADSRPRVASRAAEPVSIQGKVASFANSLDMTAQATVSSDRRYVRLSVAPVFQTATGIQQSPVVSFPVIPGGGR